MISRVIVPTAGSVDNFEPEGVVISGDSADGEVIGTLDEDRTALVKCSNCGKFRDIVEIVRERDMYDFGLSFEGETWNSKDGFKIRPKSEDIYCSEKCETAEAIAE